MISPPKPLNEVERLAALVRLKILDTAPEARFDRVTRLAAKIFQVPYSLVSLVDEDRQWFKSRPATVCAELPRAESFCGHAILEDGPLIVTDARDDVRFHDNPMVTGPMGIRSYVGFPLHTADGYRVGVLCIIDNQPRTYTVDELESLKDLAAVVEDELDAVALTDAMRRLESANNEREGERQKFEAFIENTPGLVFIKDEHSRIQFVNRRFEEAFRLTLEQLRGKSDFEWLPPDVAEQYVASDRRVLDTNIVQEFVEQVPSRNGEVGDWLCLKFPIPQPGGGRLLGGVAFDITSHRKAHEALRQTLSLQRAFLDSVDACIVATDSDGRIVRVNSSCERMCGYTSAELAGVETLLVLLDPEELERRVANLATALAPAAPTGFEALLHRAQEGTMGERSWTYVRKDGTRFPVRLSVIPLQDEEGQLNGYLTVARDITREKETERTMIRAKEAAEQASETKSRFLANMSHEIRTPLNGIIGVNTMLVETPLSADQARLAGIVQESAESLLNIVDDILDFSKVEAGLIELEESAFSLSGLFSMVQRLHSVRASARGLVVETRIAPEIPDRVVGDSMRIRQVINNFVSNATKFSEQGTITISATSESVDKKGRLWVRICVQDCGIGVSHEAQQRIFDAFAQADTSTTRRYGGTGLGLSICRQLVQLMGGEIGVESEIGQGSTFWFTLRLRKASDADLAPMAAEPDSSILLTGLRVLVAEDSNVNQLVILHELRRLGCEPVAVSNGREALRAMRTNEYDLVLMDCQMPEMDGYEAAREIRRMPAVRPELPIIAITANALLGERDRCLAAGMSGYLSKPFSRTQLREVVIEALPPGFVIGKAEGEPALGTEELEALRDEAEELGCELMQRLVEAFGLEAGEALAALETAAAALDGPRIFEAAHKLKGSGSNFGAHPLCRLCEKMEHQANDGAIAEAIACIPDLQREVARVLESLNAILCTTERTSALPALT